MDVNYQAEDVIIHATWQIDDNVFHFNILLVANPCNARELYI